ncbi:MAG: phage holin family protein [Candidatus Krumholzibacteriia bacterium]
MMEGQREPTVGARDERSLGELIKELGGESSRLLREEVQLAKAEMNEKVEVYKSSLVKMMIGVGLLLGALVVLLAAVNRGLTVLLGQFMSAEVAVWVAPLILAIIFGLIGWSMLKGAQKAMKDEGMTPHRTVDSLRSDRDWAKREVKERRNG